MTATVGSERRRGSLAERVGGFLERRVDRRGVLRRGAMVGTAMAVAPATYVARPGTAYGAVCGRDALCNDGYTEFCCTLSGANRCPPGTSLGGWWKVDGSSFCGGGPRYYMDCNAACNGCGCGGNGVCSGACSGTTCGCAFGDCNNRKAGCTNFRYGQCNQGIPCLGPIVCRVVTCTEPWRIDGSCTTAARTDNATRYHSRPCLEVDAVGGVNNFVAVPGGVRLIGWAVDPGTPAPISVVIYDCFRPVATLTAADLRPDIGNLFPAQGPNHGFDAFVRLCPGERLVSVAAVDSSGQGTTWIHHQMVRIIPNAHGHLDSVTASEGRIRAVGFVLDPDNLGPSTVDVFVDGVLAASVRADLYRADLARDLPHMGPNHGFDVTVPASPGPHNVCVVGRNVGGGTDLDLGCRPVAVPYDPVGVVESLTSSAGTLRVTGWALDQDTTGPVRVRIDVDGVAVRTALADRSRGDQYDGHGFDETVTGVAPGERAVCVVALPEGGGYDRILGCNVLAVGSVAVGQVLAVEAAPGGVRIAATPVTRTDGSPAPLRVLVDGNFRASLRGTADTGLDETLALPPGDHEVQVLAVVDGPRTLPYLMASANVQVDGPGSAQGTASAATSATAPAVPGAPPVPTGSA